MNSRPGIATEYRAALASEIRDIEHKLGRGEAKTFDQYLARCAEIRALTRALQVFDCVLSDYLSEDEVDELADKLNEVMH